DTAAALPGFFIDLDLAGPGHAEMALPRSVDAVREFLAVTMPLPPSLVVHSGGGLHLYWLFRELWTLDHPEERRAAQLRLRHFQGTIRARARERGWQFEGTADLARLLRLPGS